MSTADKMTTQQPRHEQVVEPIEVDEKMPTAQTAHLEHSLKAGLTHDEALFVHDYSQKDHEKVFRKVDWRLMPMLMALYLIANLDRYVIP